MVDTLIHPYKSPFPQTWDGFMKLEENKADLARFLSQQLIIQASGNKTIVAAGGFSTGEQAEFSAPNANTEELEARYDEAGTRIML